ncbi:MAG: hypothetical protein WCK65_13800, partial [Rhodospirillaceae bacterium]
AEQLRNPLESLRYQKTLLENLRQLETIREDLNTARAELAALVNLPLGSTLRLAPPRLEDLALPNWAMPVAEMEEAAFVNNPDLREQVYEGRIAVDETRNNDHWVNVMLGVVDGCIQAGRALETSICIAAEAGLYGGD